MAERTAGDGGFEALEAESVLQPDIDGSPESIEAEERPSSPLGELGMDSQPLVDGRAPAMAVGE